MEIKLSIKQDDIEQAIRDYVVSKGITTPVREINFQVARKGGFALTAEVEVSETPVQPVAQAPQAETQDITPEPAPEPVAEKPKAKPAPKAAKVEAEVPAPEPVTEAEDKPPFDADTTASNDDKPTEKPAPKADSKSLFG